MSAQLRIIYSCARPIVLANILEYDFLMHWNPNF